LKNIILLPVYNDWKSLNLLLEQINKKIKFTYILVVNDASTEKPYFKKDKFKQIKKIKVLTLKKKLGSQKAISIGLDYLKKTEKFFYVTIMDSDGEDSPKQLNKMLSLAKKNKKNIITSHRTKRNESLLIQLGYKIHLLISFIFTWHWISFGNFSTMHSNNLKKIDLNNTWYAYPPSILKDSNTIKVFATRQARYFGDSKVSPLKLVEHSLRILVIFYGRFLLSSSLIMLISLFLNKDFFYFTIIILTLFNALLVTIKFKHKPTKPVNYNDFLRSAIIYK